MEPRKAKDLANQVTSVLDTTAPEVRYLVMRFLMEHLGRNFPTLDWDGDEGDSALICPHCVSDIQVHNLVLFEHGWGDAPFYGIDTDDREISFNGVSDTDEGFMLCPECKLPVSPPRGWSWEWT